MIHPALLLLAILLVALGAGIVGYAAGANASAAHARRRLVAAAGEVAHLREANQRLLVNLSRIRRTYDVTPTIERDRTPA